MAVSAAVGAPSPVWQRLPARLEAFNAIAEAARIKEEARRLIKEVRPETELYAPRLAELVKVEELTPREKVFEFRFKDGKSLGHRPGQFVEVSVMGIGEAPISISSSPTRDGTFQLAIRNVGNVTSALHALKKGAIVGIRGPFGNGFPLEALEGKDLLLIAGGIGLFPLRSLSTVCSRPQELFWSGHPALRRPVASGAAVPGRARHLEPEPGD